MSKKPKRVAQTSLIGAPAEVEALLVLANAAKLALETPAKLRLRELKIARRRQLVALYPKTLSAIVGGKREFCLILRLNTSQ